MTTVGYGKQFKLYLNEGNIFYSFSSFLLGDIYPTTIPGKIFGGLAAVTGVILIAMPIGLLSSKFNEVYSLNESKRDIIKRYVNKMNKDRKEDEKIVNEFEKGFLVRVLFGQT